jgi:hypothetical protein
VTRYTDSSAADSRVSIETSVDGLTWQPLAQAEPAALRRQEAVAGQMSPPTATSRVLARIGLAGPAGSIGLNGLWFDLTLGPSSSAIGTVASEDVEVIGKTAGTRGFTVMRVGVAGPVGNVNQALRLWGAASQAALVRPGAIGSGVVALALALATGFAWRRRASRIAVVGVAFLAAIWIAAAIVSLPRVVG